MQDKFILIPCAILGILPFYANKWRLGASKEMLLTLLQKVAAGVALIYCFPQIEEGFFNTKLLKQVSIGINGIIRSALFYKAVI